jgi:hypothetical protein
MLLSFKNTDERHNDVKRDQADGDKFSLTCFHPRIDEREVHLFDCKVMPPRRIQRYEQSGLTSGYLGSRRHYSCRNGIERSHPGNVPDLGLLTDR